MTLTSLFRTVAASATVVLFAVSSAAPAGSVEAQPPAQTSGPAGEEMVHSWALAPAGSSDPSQAGNRPDLSYELDPGATVQDSITVYNYGNVALNFQIYATDAVNNDVGAFDLLAGGDQPTDVGSWIDVGQTTLTVPAGTEVTLPITITVPADASPGDHVGGILASSPVAGTGPDGKSVTVDRRTGTRVYLRVTGPVQPDLAVETVETSYEPSLNPLDGTATVTYRIRNRGNVRLGGVPKVTVSGPFGVAKQTVVEDEVEELLPGEDVEFTTTFEGVPGSAVAFTSVELGAPDDVDEANYEASGRSGFALAPPVTLLALALAVFLALRARRAYLRHRRGRVAEVGLA